MNGALTVHEESLLAAAQTAAALRGGWEPPGIDAGMALAQGERALYSTSVHIWVYAAGDASHSQGGFLAFGPPGLFLATAAGSAMLNAHRRKEAEAQAAPQWRAADQGSCVVTTTRFACGLSQGWRDLPYGALRSSSCDARGITLWYDESPPVMLQMPYPEAVFVLFRHAAYGEVIDFPIDSGLRAKAQALGRPVPG